MPSPNKTRSPRSAPDLARRRDKLRQRLKRESLDALLVVDEANVHYLTGFTGEDSWLFITRDQAILISDGRFEEQIQQECPDIDADIRWPGTGRTLSSQVADALLAGRWKSLGIERQRLTIAQGEELREKCPSAEVRGCDDFVEQLRAIKDSFEIDAIQSAIVTAERAFAAMRPTIRPIDTEKDLADRLDGTMRSLGAKSSAFDTIVAVGNRAALPHARPTRKSVGESPLLLVDWGAKQHHYHSDLTRVLITSKPTSKLERVYSTVLRAQQAGIDAIGPGATCDEVDRAARAVIEKAGLGEHFNHSLGHGLGLKVHEAPGLRANTKTPLEPGMVVTVEPGVYLKGWGGVRIEDDVFVTRSGREVLSHLPKGFDESCVF